MEVPAGCRGIRDDFEEGRGVRIVRRGSDGVRGAAAGLAVQHWMVGLGGLEDRVGFCGIRRTSVLGGASNRGGFMGGGSCDMGSE